MLSTVLMGMMTNPITPPPELVGLIIYESKTRAEMIQRAYTAGADQELERCVEWLDQNCGRWEIPVSLRAARRPQPPSLKAQALKMLRPLSNPVMPGTPEYRLYEPQAEIIRRALEALDD